MQKLEYKPGTSTFDELMKTLVDGLEKSESVIPLHRVDGSPLRMIYPEEVEEAKNSLQKKIDAHPTCCGDCPVMKEYRHLLGQLQNPQISVAVCSGSALHFLTMAQKEKVMQEFNDYLQWKSTGSSVKAEPVVPIQPPE